MCARLVTPITAGCLVRRCLESWLGGILWLNAAEVGTATPWGERELCTIVNIFKTESDGCGGGIRE